MATDRTRVLVVDDQRGMRLTLTGIFEDQGYEVTGVSDGYKAIEASRETSFDLIFMDIKMPGINGVQTCREIKKTSPDSVVVMMTGFAVEELVKEALEEGAFSVIYKPFDPEMVLKLVESVRRSVIILVVDKRTTNRVSLRAVLEENGYGVGEASDGTEILKMVKGRKHDIVLMDTSVLGNDGVLDTFQKIKALDPGVRVVFTTGLPEEESIGMALKVDAYPATDGPINPADLLELVRKITTEKSR